MRLVAPSGVKLRSKKQFQNGLAHAPLFLKPRFLECQFWEALEHLEVLTFVSGHLSGWNYDLTWFPGSEAS
jgi:hypothetical protein